MLKYYVGDLVTMKKSHACGKNEWEILKTGVDIKLRCTNCKRELFMTRFDFVGSVRKVLHDGKWVSLRTSKEIER